MACHRLQCGARQPTTLNRRDVPSGRLLSGSFTFSSRAAGASGGRGKGSLTLAALPLLARLARTGRSRRLLLSRTGTSGARLRRTSRRRPSRPFSSRRFPRNPGRTKGMLNKRVVGSRILVNAESSRGDGKIETVSGRGEYLKRATSYAGTVERTSARRESRLERTRLPRTVQPWLARNSKALDPERISLSKSAQISTGRFSRKPPQVDNRHAF